MKPMKNLASLAVISLLIAVPSAAAQEVQPIAHYGESGAGVGAFVRDLLPEGFFSKSITKDIAGGENYVAALDLSPSSPDLVGASRSFSLQGTILFLENTNDDVSDVVISVEYDNGKRVLNYLVHLEAGQRQGVDLSALDPGPSLHAVSMLPFAAALSFDDAKPREEPAVLDVGPLIRRAGGLDRTAAATPVTKWGSTCGPLQKDIKICTAGTTNCVMARANRDYYPHHIRPEQYRAVAFISYPIGTAFHCPINDSVFSMSTCSAGSYKTKRCDGSLPRHIWNGLDDTFNSCAPSTASCTSGCTGSFDITCY